MVVVVAAIIRVQVASVSLGKFVMTHVRLGKKNSHVCSSILHFSFPFLCASQIGFDIHKTRCDAREEGQDAPVSEFVGFDRE